MKVSKPQDSKSGRKYFIFSLYAKQSENQRIDYELRFREPFKSVAASYMTVERVSERDTKVKWAFDGRTAYPFNVVCLFMDMDKMIGGNLQTGLDNLKRIQEAP